MSNNASLLTRRCQEGKRTLRRRIAPANLPSLEAAVQSALGEWPNETDWLGIVLISAGVYLASGGQSPRENAE